MTRNINVESHKGVAALARPQISLPFYVIDAGINTLQRDEHVYTDGIFEDFVEILWCVKGSGEITLQDKRWQLKEDDVFYYLDAEEHALHSLSDDWTLYYVCFNGPLAEAIMCSYKYPRLQHPAEPCPVALFQDIFHIAKQQDVSAIGLLCSKVLEILARMNARTPRRMHTNTTIDSAMKFIQNNLSDPKLNIDAVADALNLSKSTLQKHFLAMTKKSIGSYIRNERFQRAIALLQHSTMPVQEVARECGYTLVPSFSRLIRRGTGFSSTELRKGQET